jgi:hypothetical protein
MGPKKIERIKITRKKEHAPHHEPNPPSALAPSPHQEPDLPSTTEESISTILGSEGSTELQRKSSLEEKLLTLLESKDEDYIIDFIYECMIKMKDRKKEIEKTDPQMWTLIQELKEMIDP